MLVASALGHPPVSDEDSIVARAVRDVVEREFSTVRTNFEKYGAPGAAQADRAASNKAKEADLVRLRSELSAIGRGWRSEARVGALTEARRSARGKAVRALRRMRETGGLGPGGTEDADAEQWGAAPPARTAIGVCGALFDRVPHPLQRGASLTTRIGRRAGRRRSARLAPAGWPSTSSTRRRLA